MSNIESIEATGASVDEAVQKALAELGAAEEDVTIEILATARSGVLGLGAREARVRVTRGRTAAASSGVAAPASTPPVGSSRPLPEPTSSYEARTGEATETRRDADLGAQASEASEILLRVLDLMGEKAEVRKVDTDPESIEIEIRGDGSGILIGRHGQTLDALEYIVNRILARRIRDAVPISLETESYRARRRDQLHRIALSMGERAKRERKPMRLDPMPPRDRRVIHVALKDDPLIATRSLGDGFLRSIEIVPQTGRGERSQPQGGNQPRGNRNRGGRSGGGGPRGDQRSEPRESPSSDQQPTPSKGGLGEQGGFKHGQKRLF